MSRNILIGSFVALLAVSGAVSANAAQRPSQTE
jgi:hypothetical protein